MGSSHSPTTVVIIDENNQIDTFNTIINDEHFHAIYYTDFDKFLQKQSLKNLSFIIIRQKNQKDQPIEYQNSLTALTQDNRRELTQMFDNVTSKKSIPLKERLISYIQKYSLQKLVLYIFVEDKHKFKLPDNESPYITLVASTIEAIKENILSNPQRQEPFDFKFRRMVKDLYKRTAIKIIYDGKGEKKQKEEADTDWDKILTQNELSYNICWGLQKFRKDLISNFSQYIIVIKSKKMLYQIIKQKDKRQLQSKIIFLGDQDGLQQKDKLSIWMINDGMTASNRTKIVKTIKNCTQKIVDEETLLSQNTIIFTNLQYTQDEKDYLKGIIIDKLRKKQSEHVQTETQINNLNLQIVSSYDHLKEKLISSVFSFLITFDCLIPDIQQLKRWIRKQKLNYRVYIYSAEQQPKTIETLLKSKQDNPGIVKEYLDKRIIQIIKGASFKIKFQISPIDSITSYKANEKVLKHLTSKMGLITTNIPNRQQFTEKYLKRNRQQFIESYHLICRYQDYQKDLATLLDSQGKIPIEKDMSPSKLKPIIQPDQRDSYFNKVKVIIFDEKQKIKKSWTKISNDRRIVFVHYNLSHIDDYLDNIFTSKVAVSFFVKKALPTFFTAMYKIEDNIEKDIFLDLKMTSSIMAKSKLLKQVFNDDNFKMSMEFKQSFYKFQSSPQINPDFSAFLKAYCNLWRVGYQLIKNPSQMKDCINQLKQDIKRCLFKCKSYDLIDVSNDEFFYFYLDRLDACHTFIDLQIAVIYIFSLPHGFADIFQNIFKNPYTTCLTPKIFSSYLVTLLTTFVSFEDQVMGKTRVVTYVDDKDMKTMAKIETNDTLYNTCFLQCGKDQSKAQNEQNNCLFFQFQDVPMLAQSRIKNYLFIQRFSFYKESTEYLIAPYTEFIVKEKKIINDKYHIVLAYHPRKQQTFISQILKNNDVDQQQLFNVIKDEITTIEHHTFDKEDSQIINGIKSLYKKAEIISLNEQRLQLVKSIKQGFEYRDFLHELKSQHYMSALSHIYRKESTKKSTSQLQAHKFKNMLGVQKSYLYFKMSEHHLSVNEIQKVIQFLDARVKQASQDEVLLRVKLYKEKIEDIIQNKINKLNEQEKAQKGFQKKKEMNWTVKYLPTRQQFYLEPIEQNDKIILMPFHILHPFGQHENQEKNYPFYSITTLEEVIQEDKMKLQRKNTISKGEIQYKDGKGKTDKKKKSKPNNPD